MLSRFLRLSILCVFVLSLASPGFAARRSSLGGNLLIKDTDDIFFYPQRVSDYNRLVTYDFGASESEGSGGMIFGGETFVIGAFSHRSDFLGANRGAFRRIGDAGLANNGRNDLDGIITAGPTGGPYNWIDLLLGWQGGDNPWGARLSIGRAEVDPVGDENKDDVTSVNVVIGLSVNDIDVSGEFSIASAKTQTPAVGGAPSEEDDSSPLGFAVSARKTATAESDDLQLGWLGMFSFLSGGGDNTVTGGSALTTDLSELAFVFGAGPVYTPHERTSVAMYGTFEYERFKFERPESAPGAGDAVDATVTDYVIPGWHVAAEVEISSWLQARAGLVSEFAIANAKDDAAGAEAQASALDFSWHTGIGINFDDFQIDGYIHPDVLTSGTDVLGNSDDMFGLVTASYAF